MSANLSDDSSVLLRMLYAIGANKPEKSVSIEEISEWTETERSKIETDVQKLAEQGYLQSIQAEGTDKYHVTLDGIRKCERLSRERINAVCQLEELKGQLGRGAITQEEYEQKEKELLKKAWDPT